MAAKITCRMEASPEKWNAQSACGLNDSNLATPAQIRYELFAGATEFVRWPRSYLGHTAFIDVACQSIDWTQSFNRKPQRAWHEFSQVASACGKRCHRQCAATISNLTRYLYKRY